MGYTHYWRRKKVLDKEKFRKVVQDFKIVANAIRDKVPLAGPLGEGQPIITDEKIAFNGLRNCGHESRNLGITWPSKSACCVTEDGKAHTEGSWFAGALLATRCCDGDCSHESFILERVYNKPFGLEPDESGRHFEFCKTAYKPYDLAVTACLIIAKHHLGDEIVVSSDGEEKDWIDAMLLCEKLLGYGNDFRLER